MAANDHDRPRPDLTSNHCSCRTLLDSKMKGMDAQAAQVARLRLIRESMARLNHEKPDDSADEANGLLKTARAKQLEKEAKHTRKAVSFADEAGALTNKTKETTKTEETFSYPRFARHRTASLLADVPATSSKRAAEETTKTKETFSYPRFARHRTASLFADIPATSTKGAAEEMNKTKETFSYPRFPRYRTASFLADVPATSTKGAEKKDTAEDKGGVMPKKLIPGRQDPTTSLYIRLPSMAEFLTSLSPYPPSFDELVSMIEGYEDKHLTLSQCHDYLDETRDEWLRQSQLRMSGATAATTKTRKRTSAKKGPTCITICVFYACLFFLSITVWRYLGNSPAHALKTLDG